MARQTVKKDIESEFNKFESQIISQLKNNKLSINEDDDGNQIKRKLKKYQSNLKETLKNFKKYEQLSDELLNYKQKEIAKNFTKYDEKFEELFDYKDEISVEEGNVKSYKKQTNKHLER